MSEAWLAARQEALTETKGRYASKARTEQDLQFLGSTKWDASSFEARHARSFRQLNNHDMSELGDDEEPLTNVVPRSMQDVATLHPTTRGPSSPLEESTNRKNSLLYHFVRFTGPAAGLDLDRSPFMEIWMPIALGSELGFNIVLLMAASHRATLESDASIIEDGSHPITNELTRIDIAALKNTSTELLNTIINDRTRATTDETIGLTALLIGCEPLVNMHTPVTKYLAGLQRMVKLRGGIHLIHLPMAIQILAGATKVAILTDTRPIISPPPGLPSRLKLSTVVFPPALAKYDRLATSFLDDKSSLKFFHRHIVEAFRDLRDITVIANVVRNEEAKLPLRVLRQYELVHALMEYSLASLPYDAKDYNARRSPVQEIFRIAMVIYANSVLWAAKSSVMLMQVLSARLNKIIDSMDLTVTLKKFPELFLWILVQRFHVGASIQQETYLLTLHNAISLLGIESHLALQDMLEGWLYIDDLHKSTVRKIWETYSSRRGTSSVQHQALRGLPGS